MIITFSGDVAFNNYFKTDEFNNILDDKIIDFLKNSDYNIFNIEGALTNHNSIKSNGASHSSDPNAIEIIRDLQCNIFNLANNHIMDCGEKGLKETLRLAKENGINTIGAGVNINMASEPLYVNAGDIVVSIISISHPEGIIAREHSAGIFTESSRRLIRKRLNEMKKKSDWVVLVYHGGEEYSLTPNPNRRKKFLKYLDYGADIVVSHHAHVSQGFESINGKYIFYSLGNFIFDTDIQRGKLGTDMGMLLKVIFTKSEIKVDKMFVNNLRGRKRIISNDEAVLKEIDVKSLKRDWEREAYRVILESRKKRNMSFNKNHKNIESKQIGIVKLLNNIVKKLYKIIKYQHVRDMYIGAIKYYTKIKYIYKS